MTSSRYRMKVGGEINSADHMYADARVSLWNKIELLCSTLYSTYNTVAVPNTKHRYTKHRPWSLYIDQSTQPSRRLRIRSEPVTEHAAPAVAAEDKHGAARRLPLRHRLCLARPVPLALLFGRRLGRGLRCHLVRVRVRVGARVRVLRLGLG